jgi:Protein of unknown function (DUF2948)
LPGDPLLHLTAFDGEDLSVISAQMQDAVIRFGDIKYLIKQRQFVLVANRFAWDAAPAKERRRTGLQVTDVTGVKRQGPNRPDADTILSLLAITFTPSNDPLSGEMTFMFSGGHAIALAVACIDVHLDDLGPAWSTEKTPGHGA